MGEISEKLDKSFESFKNLKEFILKPFSVIDNIKESVTKKRNKVSHARSEFKLLDIHTRNVFFDELNDTQDNLQNIEDNLQTNQSKKEIQEIKEEIADNILTKEEQELLINQYGRNQEGYCLKEVREYIQHLSKKNIVTLPPSMDKEARGSKAAEFGEEIKKNAQHLTAERQQYGLEAVDISKKSIEESVISCKKLRSPFFTIVLRNGNKPGHICVGYKTTSGVVCFDNSAQGSGSADPKNNDIFYLKEYVEQFTKKGYELDAVVGIPLKKESFPMT